MELTGIGPGGEFGDEIEFSEQFTHHLTGILPLTQLLELTHDARERILGLRDRDIRVILALPFEARMVLA